MVDIPKSRVNKVLVFTREANTFFYVNLNKDLHHQENIPQTIERQNNAGA